MNERYLFRGKRTYNGEWVTGFVGIDEYTYITTYKELGDGTIMCLAQYRVDPATIGQCTGKRDKNEKLIFEGDVVCSLGQLECDEPGTVDYIGIVVWDDDVYGFYVNGCSLNGFCIDFVQGNIHDNPELLNGERVG